MASLTTRSPRALQRTHQVQRWLRLRVLTVRVTHARVLMIRQSQERRIPPRRRRQLR